MLAGQGFPDFSFCENAGFLPAHHALSLKSVIPPLNHIFSDIILPEYHTFLDLSNLRVKKTAVM